MISMGRCNERCLTDFPCFLLHGRRPSSRISGRGMKKMGVFVEEVLQRIEVFVDSHESLVRY